MSAFEFDLLSNIVRANKERFIARLQRNVAVEGECIVWTGAANRDGYPKMNFRIEGGKHVQCYVHRLFAILATAAPIPPGHEIDHTCRNRRCVKHLDIVPAVVNKQLVAKRRKQRGV